MVACKEVTVWYAGTATVLECYASVPPQANEDVLRGVLSLAGPGAVLYTPCDAAGPAPSAAPDGEADSAPPPRKYVPAAALFNPGVPISSVQLVWRPGA